MFQSWQQKFQIWRLTAQEKAERAKCKLKRTANPPTYQDVLEGKSEGKIILQQSLIGYKAIACTTSSVPHDIYLAQITVPAGATVIRSRRYAFWPNFSSIPSPKTRTDTHTIDKILTDDKYIKCYSRHDPNFIYEVGKTYKPDKLDEDLDEEHTAGLHFYMDRSIAEKEN